MGDTGWRRRLRQAWRAFDGYNERTPAWLQTVHCAAAGLWVGAVMHLAGVRW